MRSAIITLLLVMTMGIAMPSRAASMSAHDFEFTSIEGAPMPRC